MNIRKRIARCAAALFAALAVVMLLPGANVYALSDIDFTIDVDTSKEYIAGNIVEAPILIKTQTDNGYVEMTMLLKYNQDTFACNSIYDDVEGFTTTITDDGLEIFYKSPDNSKSQIDTVYKLDIQFTVKTGVASGKYKLELDVDTNNVYGYDKNGNKEKGLLTISDANAKELTVIETGDGVTTAAEDGSEANFYTGIATTTQAVEAHTGGGCSAGGIIGGILGALVLFAAGVIVGFLLCQKRMNDEGYYMNSAIGNSGGISEKRPRGGFEEDEGDGSPFDQPDPNAPQSARQNAAQDAYSQSQGGSIFDEQLGDEYAARGRQQSRQAQPRPAAKAEDEVDMSYFGDAVSQRIGDPTNTRYEEEEDEFPEAFRPRRYRGGTENRFSNEFDSVLGSGKRMERNDDGYGAFTVSNEDESMGGMGGYGGVPTGNRFSTDAASSYGSMGAAGGASGYGAGGYGGAGSYGAGASYATDANPYGGGDDDDSGAAGRYGARGDRRLR